MPHVAAKVLCRFNDIILARVFAHADVLELSKHSKVPGNAVMGLVSMF